MKKVAIFTSLLVVVLGCGKSGPPAQSTIERQYAEQIQFLHRYATDFERNWYGHERLLSGLLPLHGPDTSVLKLPEIIQASVSFSTPTSEEFYIVSGLLNDRGRTVHDAQEPSPDHSVVSRGEATMRDGTTIKFLQYRALLPKTQHGKKVGYEILFAPNKMRGEPERTHAKATQESAPRAAL